MAKKHKCKECANHSGWAVPDGVSEQNYEYAKQCLAVMSRSMTCMEKQLVRKIDHELYCNKFCKVDELGQTGEYYESDRVRSIEQLKAQIAEYEKQRGLLSLNIELC